MSTATTNHRRAQNHAQLDGVDAESIQHVLIENGQLLNYIVHADRPGGQPQKIPQLRICYCGDTRRPVTRKVNWHTVGFAMVQRS